MTVLQILVNILVAILLVALANWGMNEVGADAPGILVFLVDVIIVIATFAGNIAARLGVK